MCDLFEQSMDHWAAHQYKLSGFCQGQQTTSERYTAEPIPSLLLT